MTLPHEKRWLRGATMASGFQCEGKSRINEGHGCLWIECPLQSGVRSCVAFVDKILRLKCWCGAYCIVSGIGFGCMIGRSLAVLISCYGHDKLSFSCMAASGTSTAGAAMATSHYQGLHTGNLNWRAMWHAIASTAHA